jgi:predicted SAM-dependent methyltransferase
LEHLKYYYIDNALNEIKRVLKRKGLLILSTPNLASLENRLFLLLGGSPYLGGGIISPAHNREYTLREVLDILQRVGFSVILHRYSMARDKVTHKSSDFIIREHVLKSFIKYKNWINVGRALVYPLKFAVPSLRSMFFIIAEKAE